MHTYTTTWLAALVIAPFLMAAPAATQTDHAEQTEVSDDGIVVAIERELFAAKGVSGSAVDVTVEDGIATLRGTVGNILAKERAVRVASMIKGVRSVVDLIDVRANDVPDGVLRDDVVAALMSDPATESWEIGVEVDDGQVTLTGTVDSSAERELAAIVAKSVYGVRGLTNRLTVDYATDRPDTEIRDEIVERLEWDSRVDDHLLEVSVNDGAVTLTGTVGSVAERARARADAWVAGVTSVDDEAVDVEWWARDEMRETRRWKSVDDQQIRQAVIDAFVYDPRVFSFEPEVYVVGGVVTLRGTVDSVKARRAAAETAMNTRGVWRVENHLRVSPPTPLADDATIAANAMAALERDAIVHAEDIVVTVDDGLARLDGEVSSYFAREQAEDVVARVSGVTEIDNDLTVDYAIPSLAHTYYDWDPVLYDYDFDYHTIRTKPDWEIRSDIVQELWWSPFVDRDEVTVSVEDGVATLTGEVDTWYERNAATENAIEGGAVKVINKLDVSFGPDEG